MGKGDARTRRGKIWRGTYGNSRPHRRKGRFGKRS
ncbi:30S ribosomal protein THX [Thiohalobacter sp.]|nr:30S ribosomal protein THX [Thiohalobacter sp.]